MEGFKFFLSSLFVFFFPTKCEIKIKLFYVIRTVSEQYPFVSYFYMCYNTTLIMFPITANHSTERQVVLITLHQSKEILLFPINLQNNMCWPGI